MSSRDKNKPNKKDENRYPSNSAQTTTPVNQRSGDKLRENPSNDEETISQNPKKSDSQQTEQLPLTRQHEDDKNQVTNEEDQKDIVNPGGGDWEKVD